MKKMYPLALSTLLQGTGIGILIPVMTHYVLSLGASDTIAPLIFSTFSLCAFMSSFFWGKLSDRMGRKFVLFISTLGSTMSYFWFTVSSSLWEVFASRAVAGLMAGFTIAAFAFVADSYSAKHRAKAMGFLGASFGMGFVIGPGIGALLVQKNAYILAGFGSFLVSLLSMMIIIIAVNESDGYKKNSSPSFKVLLKAASVRPALIVAFIVGIVFTMIEGSFALFIYNKFNATARDVGIALVLAGIFNIIIQGGVVGRLVAKFGEIHTLRLGIVFLTIGLISLTRIEVIGMYVPMIFVSIAMGLYTPALQSYTARISPDNLKGGMGGMLQAINNLSRVIGPAIASFAMVSFADVSPYIGGVVVIMIPYLMLRFMRL